MRNKIILGILLVFLAGCATSTRYVSYTYEHFAPKNPYYNVNVYPTARPDGITDPYYVIGKVSLEGFASNGANPALLTNRAMQQARKRGADAIVNAKTVVFHYYGDVLFRFTGDFIVYTHTQK